MTEGKLTLGQYFKLEREKRGITLEAIELKTKISKQTLQFMEDDRLDVLPPRAFLRGFLQCIAKEFDMDSEELIRYLDEALTDFGKAQNLDLIKDRRRKYGLLYLFIVLIVAVAIAVGLSLCIKRSTHTSQQSLQGHVYAQNYMHKDSGLILS